MVFFNAMAEIALFSVAITLVSRLIQEKLVDKKKQKIHQDRMKENQKRINELMKRNDEAAKKEMEILQGEALESMNVIMQGNMKYMFFTMPLFLAFYWVLGQWYGNAPITLPFPFPVIHRNFSFEITSTISWLWWYIYMGVIASILINAITSSLKGAKK